MRPRSVRAIVEPKPENKITPLLQAELDKILALASSRAQSEGTVQTSLPFLWIMKSSKATPLTHGLLNPSFCIVVQGDKKVHIGSEIVRYGAGSYLASIIDMPAAGQILTATKSTPYLGVRIDLTIEEVASVVMDAKIKIKPKDRLNPAAFIGETTPELLEVFVKLLKTLEDPQDAHFLGTSLKREIIYRLLTGADGDLFYQNTVVDQQTRGIGKAIKWIKDNFNSPFTIEQLAKESNMSVSSLHHKFKMVTTMGPLQYQKQLRLQEARRLLMAGTFDATMAAMEVGYESPSQFNREYRRLFGLPPLRDIKAMRKSSSYR